MKLSVTTCHVLTFTVEEYQQTEGGMDVDTFGESMETLAEAVTCLELARRFKPKADWIIVVRVKTSSV